MSIESITAAMAASTSAYAAIIDGVLNPMTLHMVRNQAARAAYSIKAGHLMVTLCTDPDCECIVKFLAQDYPDVKVVPVDVVVRP